jgi:hypothetical protein
MHALHQAPALNRSCKVLFVRACIPVSESLPVSEKLVLTKLGLNTY